jgi:hypothetical protein
MTGGEQTVAQMDALSGTLVAAGVSADSLHDAIAAATNALTASKAATAAANAALAEGNTRYRELEQAANQAAKAQEKSAKLGVVRPEVAAAAAQASAALAAHETELRKLEASAKDATAKENALATSLTNVKKLATATAAENAKAAAQESRAASESDRNLKKLRAGLAGVGGPLGSLGAAAASSVDDFRDLEESIGSTGAKMAFFGGAAASVVAAVVLVTAAVAAGTIAIAAWAVGLADANRNAGIASEAQEALHPELVAMRDVIAEVSDETGAHSDELQEWIGNLKEAKVKAEDIPDALRAIALSEAALGNGGSADFIKDIKAGKVAVSALSAEVNSKLGGLVQAQMKGLSAQAERFKRNYSSLFGSLDIEPALDGLQKLVALFDENTVAGGAIKFLFESIFQPLINQADNAATAVEAFALGVLIGLTKLYIAAKPTIKALGEMFGFDTTSTADTMAMITKAAEYLVPALVVAAAIFGTFVVAVGAVVAVVIAVQLAIYSMVAAVVYAGVEIVQGVQGAWQSVVAYLNGIVPGLGEMGTQIMLGLANGITSAAGLPLQAITSAVSGAIAGAKNLLGIHSPSKVFAEIGGYTAEGFADGVDDGADDAQSSLERMASPTAVAASAPAGASAAAGSSGGGITVHLEGAQLTFSGLPDAPSGMAQFVEMLTRALEGMQLQAEGPATT